MEIVNGAIVRANAGRDKGKFFVVIGFDGEYVLISDGKSRKLEKPKRKKEKHLSVSNTIVKNGSMSTNREIRKTLSEFNKT